MKKLLFSLIVSVAMLACTNQETKTATTNVMDDGAGTVTSVDAKSIALKKGFEAYMNNDTNNSYSFADSVKLYDAISDYVENGEIKPHFVGLKAVINGLSMDHKLFNNIKLTTDNIKTVVFKNGSVYSSCWTTWTGTGNITKTKISAPVYIVYKWDGDKIATMTKIFDPTTYKLEIAAASQKK